MHEIIEKLEPYMLVFKEEEKVKMNMAHHNMKMMPAMNKVAPSKKRQTTMPADWVQPDRVIKLGTKPGLKYDVTNFEVKAGSKIRLIFNNDSSIR
jgi:hypothetical protein